MVKRYLKAQLFVLLCGGVVGPIFLAVFFAVGPMTRPALNWMFWAGLIVTAVDVLAALALTVIGAAKQDRREHLSRYGVLTRARVVGIADTSWFVNDRQVITVTLRIEAPGFPAFETRQTVASSPTRMQILNTRTLVVVVEPGTQKFDIDWDASAVIAGVSPAEFTIAEDNTTYDLTGRADPLMEVLNVLHVNGIPFNEIIDLRSNPTVRRQVVDIVRRAGRAGSTAPEPPVRTVAERLQQLDTLRATGAVTDEEYAAKRREILAEL